MVPTDMEYGEVYSTTEVLHIEKNRGAAHQKEWLVTLRHDWTGGWRKVTTDEERVDHGAWVAKSMADIDTITATAAAATAAATAVAATTTTTTTIPTFDF